LIEGPHLVGALLDRGLKPVRLLLREESRNAEIKALVKRTEVEPIELSKSLFNSLADTETPQGIAAEIDIPRAEALNGDCVFLEGVQDAGNVGAIIRSAAAFGVGTVVVDQACADPWSPKVLRAGVGGHFGLQIRQVSDLATALNDFKGTLICTVPRRGTKLSEANLNRPLGWIFGSEANGVRPETQEKASLRITIPTAPGTDSLNVAAAAAICLYEVFRSQK
jgi:RNA methyltransferase, TrmH family